MRRFALISTGLFACLLHTASVAGEYVEPGFRVQTGLLAVDFSGDQQAASLAFAGRDDGGAPMLGLMRMADEGLEYREIALPDGAVAVDVGAVDGAEAVYVLGGGAIHALTGFDADLAPVAEASSLYRGRSLAELTSDLDFARDIDGDGRVEFLVPDFDVMHVVDAPRQRAIELPSYRRGYDRTVTYRAPTVTAAAEFDDGTLYSVRGDTLLTFEPLAVAASKTRLALGLSDEVELETYYNSYEDIDQNDIVLREVERFTDVNGDGLPDIVTLETVSAGVFDKTTTYRIHHGRDESGRLRFDGEADTVLSSRGFQLGAQIEPLDESRNIIVTASVQVGVRAIIGALFSRAVTMRVEIHPPLENGTVASDVSTTIKVRVKFDFGSGQVEFPTIAFGDIDGDGVNDLVVKERRRDMNWRRGNGDGSFAERSESLSVTGPADGTNVVLGDLDGDGRDELVALYGRADGDELNGRIGVFDNDAGSR